MKFETAQIHFLGDGFCCRCRRRSVSPLMKDIKSRSRCEGTKAA